MKTTFEYTPFDSSAEADEALAGAVRHLVATLSPWRKSPGCLATSRMFRRLAVTFTALADHAEKSLA